MAQCIQLFLSTAWQTDKLTWFILAVDQVHWHSSQISPQSGFQSKNAITLLILDLELDLFCVINASRATTPAFSMLSGHLHFGPVHIQPLQQFFISDMVFLRNPQVPTAAPDSVLQQSVSWTTTKWTISQTMTKPTISPVFADVLHFGNLGVCCPHSLISQFLPPVYVRGAFLSSTLPPVVFTFFSYNW